MSDVWYPGRPPLRTPEIVEGLTHYLGALQGCADQCTSAYLEQANQICDHVLSILQEESDDCLGSDTDINALMKLLPQSFRAAVLCATQDAWDNLEEIISNIDAVRWSLIYKLDKITEGGTDDRRSTATKTSGRATLRPHSRENTEQTHWTQGSTPEQHEAEEALRSRDKEAGLTTETNILSPTPGTPSPPPPSSDG